MIYLFLLWTESKYLAIDFGGEFVKSYFVDSDARPEIAVDIHSRRNSKTFIGFRSETNFDVENKSLPSVEECHLLDPNIGDKSISISQIRPWMTTGFIPLFTDLTYEKANQIARNLHINTTAARIPMDRLLPIFCKMYMDSISPIDPIDGVTLAVPAHTTIPQRRQLAEAFSIAGYRVDAVIDDATATAHTYALEKTAKFQEEQKTILFVDVGATELKAYTVRFELRGKNSNAVATRLSYSHKLGEGGAFLTARVAERLAQKLKIDPTPAEFRLLVDAAEKLKKRLTLVNEASTTIEDFRDKDIEVRMDRQELNKLAEPILRELDAVCDDARSGIDVDEVEMIGGSAKIPIVREHLTSFLGVKKLGYYLNSDETIAIGAGYFAQYVHRISPYQPIKTPCNCSAHTIGLRSGGKVFPLVERGAQCRDYLEFQAPFTRFLMAYDEDEARDLRTHEFGYKLEETEQPITVSFDCSPADVSGFHVCNETHCEPVNFTFYADYEPDTEMYNAVVERRARANAVLRAHTFIDDYIRRARADFERNRTIRFFSNADQRIAAKKVMSSVAEWAEANAGLQDPSNWSEKVRALRNSLDPIYYRASENHTYMTAMETLYRAIQATEHYAFEEFPVNKSWVGAKVLRRLQDAVNRTREWFDIVANTTYARNPWENREYNSTQVYEKYENLTMEFDRVYRMVPYKPKTSPTPTPAPSNEGGVMGLLKKKLAGLKEKLRLHVTEKGDVLEENEL